MTVTPTQATAGTTGNAFTFRYAAPAKLAGVVSLDIPAGWTTPQATNAAAPGFVNIPERTCASATLPATDAISGSGPWTVLVNIDCAKNKFFVLGYGAGGTDHRPTGGPTPHLHRTSQAGRLQQLHSARLLAGCDGPCAFVRAGAVVGPHRVERSHHGRGGGSVTVTARDGSGNTATSYVGTVSFSSSDGTAGLPIDYTFAAGDAGSHTFTSVVLRTAGNQSVTATDTAAATITGAQNVTVMPGAPDHLAFGVQPSATTSGATISPSPTVRIEDVHSNLTTSTADVALALTGPAGATLSGITSTAAVAGVASFNDLVVHTAGTYGLAASSAALTGTTSATFAVAAGPAQSLVVSGLADPTVAGAAGWSR